MLKVSKSELEVEMNVLRVGILELEFDLKTNCSKFTLKLVDKLKEIKNCELESRFHWLSVGR